MILSNKNLLIFLLLFILFACLIYKQKEYFHIPQPKSITIDTNKLPNSNNSKIKKNKFRKNFKRKIPNIQCKIDRYLPPGKAIMEQKQPICVKWKRVWPIGIKGVNSPSPSPCSSSESDFSITNTEEAESILDHIELIDQEDELDDDDYYGDYYETVDLNFLPEKNCVNKKTVKCSRARTKRRCMGEYCPYENLVDKCKWCKEEKKCIGKNKKCEKEKDEKEEKEEKPPPGIKCTNDDCQGDQCLDGEKCKYNSKTNTCKCEKGDCVKGCCEKINSPKDGLKCKKKWKKCKSRNCCYPSDRCKLWGCRSCNGDNGECNQNECKKLSKDKVDAMSRHNRECDNLVGWKCKSQNDVKDCTNNKADLATGLYKYTYTPNDDNCYVD